VSISRGLFESLVTQELRERLADVAPDLTSIEPLRNADAADRIAFHLARVIERAIEAFPEADRAEAGARVASAVIARLHESTGKSFVLVDEPDGDPRVLRAVRGRRPDGLPEIIQQPMIPLLDTVLLTNSPGEPRVGHQIQAEIESADRIDVVMAFIRRSGIMPLRDHLRRHVDAGRPLRVLTTVYTGSTEAAALELLSELGAEVRVSYDTSSTRLHAKAWVFHRTSGFSTAYVGSSNLTHSAQVTGLEWNVRVSMLRNRAILEKIAAVFESYWEQADFEPFDLARYREAEGQERRSGPASLLPPTELRLEPFQERLLEQVALARSLGRHRNLLVSATGTGKTVMAAVDYARLRTTLQRARLLFVAHREELLAQARATFAHALRDTGFGELWVGGRRPQAFEHVFASIQSLSATGVEFIDPSHFDVVIVDEFHHAAAASYTRLLERLAPVELLGLTATPERSDGLPILDWFDGRIAAELRLWDAIDQHRLTPFAYYGIADALDLRDIPWRRGRGYDVEGVTGLITSTDVWARRVLAEFQRHVGDTSRVRALGFCVSVEHACFMARVFVDNGIRAAAVWADTPEAERRLALEELAAGSLNVLFSVDLFNEGVDVPSVDALLMLRPTDSSLLFLQQLGRGLRKSAGKSSCTVLDFVGQHRKEFRLHNRFQALLGGSRATIRQQVVAGFPFLPAGCHMELDRVSQERVLESIRTSLPSRWAEKARELRALNQEQPGISLGDFLERSGLDLDDVYSSTRSWSDLKAEAGIPLLHGGPEEATLRKACGRLLHVDDPLRLTTWLAWLKEDVPLNVAGLTPMECRLLRMLLAPLLEKTPTKGMSLAQGVTVLWKHPQVCAELVDLFETLSRRITHVPVPLTQLSGVPFVTPARYSRLEILAGFDAADGTRMPTWREGVRYFETHLSDVFVMTLDKTTGQFSPTTRYRDYAISRDLVHWESQSTTSSDSPTGRRYREHVPRGSHVILFGRVHADDRAFYCLGPARYVRHEGSRPMAVTWKLEHPLPGDLFQEFAAAVA
jgi:superfamily II DNA or RNA helicase